MAIASFMPYVEYGSTWMIKVIGRYLDKRIVGHETQKVTIQNYVMLYSGPDVLLQIKYSIIMT